MKNLITHYLRTLLILVAVLCASATAWSQSISKEATCEESPSAAPMLKAPTLQAIHLSGDVNCNGEVDINDVTALINTILTGNRVPNGDVNSDGEVDINDVTMLISLILNGAPTYDVAAGIEALNHIYRSMRSANWTTTGNTHQTFGISAYNLAAEVMGDDMIMGAQGSGWFWFDAGYNVKTRYIYTSWRSYDLWNAYYTWIANANYILKVSQSMAGSTSEVNYIKGQAHAIRAYSYFMLAQWFARTYKGHESEPCVPLFTGTYFTGSTGASRATVSAVYAQIDADINLAINMLNGTVQQVPDHIGYAVALGLRARIALVKEDWDTAYESANQAKTASGKSIQEVSAFAGLNDATAGNVMWGARIPDDEVGMYASFWAHMDHSKTYAQRAPKQITPWLYNKMNATDTRRAWWDPSSTYSTGGYATQKFSVREGTEWGGDYIYMRVEEMYLIAAEAACRRNQPTRAKANLTALMQKRDPNYLCPRTGTSLGDLTTDETGSLLEEILIQRRIELWGEDGRILTIRRLQQGFERPAEQGWPAAIQLPGKALYNPESYAWVLTIPEAEFDGNANMNPEILPVGDQNPLGDVSAVDQNLTFETASSSMTTARTDFYYTVTVIRESTVGEYITSAILNTTDGDGLSTSQFNLTFADGQSTAEVRIACNPLTLGRTYHGTLTLSPCDVACYTGGSQISTHTFTINCQNSNPAGQKISFAQPSYSLVSNYESLSVSIPLTREKTDDEYTATLILSDVQGNVELTQPQIYFAKGASTAAAWLYFSHMDPWQTYSCVLTLSPQDVSSGGEITSTQVSVTRENWMLIGSGTYESGLWGETFDVNIQQQPGTNTYRLMEFYSIGYNVEFTIDGNSVYINPQPCYFMSEYGTLYMKGYANQDNSGYAGTYDPNTKTATLQIRYYVDEGAFPTCNETLIMP